MTLSNDEYKIEGNGIWIRKDALERCKLHYAQEADAYKKDAFRYPYYLGKSEVFLDLLKMFEPLEG